MKKTKKVWVLFLLFVIFFFSVLAMAPTSKMQSCNVTAAKAKMPSRKSTTLIVVHHSASESGNAESIRNYHKRVKGWSDIGYHFVILQDGKVEAGRPEGAIGAHAKTGRAFSRNNFSVGVCLIGNDNFTSKQKEALVKLLSQLCKKYGIDPLDKAERKGIQGHHEKCPGPGLDLVWVKKEVAKRIGNQK